MARTVKGDYMKDAVPGTLRTFDERTGGFENYQYNTRNPEKNDPKFQFTEEEADKMLESANSFINEFFPWMGDFIIFQLKDGTVRLDAADRAFLSVSR